MYAIYVYFYICASFIQTPWASKNFVYVKISDKLNVSKYITHGSVKKYI